MINAVSKSKKQASNMAYDTVCAPQEATVSKNTQDRRDLEKKKWRNGGEKYESGLSTCNQQKRSENDDIEELN